MALAAVASAGNLVSNGDFTDLSNGAGQLSWNTNATDWTVAGGSDSGYSFIYTPGSLDTTGTPNGEYGGNIYMWGSHDGGVDAIPSDPFSGNILAADGAYQTAAIQQTITGLTAGQTYDLSFYYAGAQQTGYYTSTQESWQVSLGSQTYNTATINNPAQGFTGWYQQTFAFTAESTSETLSFLAAGTPNGEPPFSLLGGVSLQAAPVPEPFTLSIAAAGVGLAIRRRFRKSA